MAAEYTWVEKELRVVKFESARSPERYRSNWVRLLLSTWANQVGNVSAEGDLGRDSFSETCLGTGRMAWSRTVMNSVSAGKPS